MNSAVDGVVDLNREERITSSLVDLCGEGEVDYSDIFLQASCGHSASFENGSLEELSSGITWGCGARCVSGDHVILSHYPSVMGDEVHRCLADAASKCHLSLPQLDLGSAPLLELSDTERGLSLGGLDFLYDIDRRVRGASALIRQVTLRYRASLVRVAIFRGDGVVRFDRRWRTLFAADVVTEKEGLLQRGYEVKASAEPIDQFWSHVEPLAVAMTAAQRALLMLDASPCPAGRMPVILAGEAGGTMVHEACGHGLEADSVQKDYSIYRDRLGTAVASPLVTLVDDATLKGAFGSYEVDDEGTPAERSVLIENGVLKCYLTDILSAKKGGLPLTGNGRRESYRHVPIPRMSNTFILPGNCSFSEIVGQVRHGLLVKRMGGGEVNPTSGDFVFHVAEGYLVEDGSLSPVRGAILAGNGPQALKDVLAVGDDLHFEPGVCGKLGQGVPVTDGQPTLLIRELTVGGSDTDHGF
ncbi:MAG: TldD protein [Synergistaceae bacterium]|nr:TldD protein [Synergistaceae bacterium]